MLSSADALYLARTILSDAPTRAQAALLDAPRGYTLGTVPGDRDLVAEWLDGREPAADEVASVEGAMGEACEVWLDGEVRSAEVRG